MVLSGYRVGRLSPLPDLSGNKAAFYNQNQMKTLAKAVL